jgi:hypothetical protein
LGDHYRVADFNGIDQAFRPRAPQAAQCSVGSSVLQWFWLRWGAQAWQPPRTTLLKLTVLTDMYIFELLQDCNNAAQ